MKKISGEKIGDNKPWVARITGPDKRYKLAREFVNGIRDSGCSNSVGSRGVITTWSLPDGIYEISKPRSWRDTDRFYARITGDTLERMTTVQVLDEVERIAAKAA